MQQKPHNRPGVRKGKTEHQKNINKYEGKPAHPRATMVYLIALWIREGSNS
jgi:hypothetical protein